MSAAPQFKVFSPAGEYVAAVKELEAGAALLAFYGKGATLRWGHQKSMTLWTEGTDGQAAESYDAVAIEAAKRIDVMTAQVDRYLANKGKLP